MAYRRSIVVTSKADGKGFENVLEEAETKKDETCRDDANKASSFIASVLDEWD